MYPSQLCLTEGAKDECNVVEVVAQNHDHQEIAVPVANLRLSCQPMVSAPSVPRAYVRASVCVCVDFSTGHTRPGGPDLSSLSSSQLSLDDFQLQPPVTFRLKSGSGPVRITGRHQIGEGGSPSPLVVSPRGLPPRHTSVPSWCSPM